MKPEAPGIPVSNDAPPKVLHYGLDEKFMPFVRKVYEAAFPGRNRFRVMLSARVTPRFFHPAGPRERISPRYWFSADLKHDLDWCDCVVVHFMTPWFAKAIRVAPPGALVVWGAWGGDFYHLIPAYAGSLYLCDTGRLVAQLSGWRVPGPGRAFELAVDWLLRAFLPVWERDVIDRIDAVTMLPAEHRMLADAVPGFRARHVQLHYYSVEDVFARGPAAIQGSDILVGNSATPTNNHLEAFALLRGIDLGDRRIVVPLGYGMADYAEAVCAAGARSFGARFVPLRGFLPLEEFNRAIAGCSTVIMNHVRQQAFGTINTALFKGAKVFLRPENPLLAFYRGLGARLFGLPHGNPDRDELLAPLSEAERQANRQALLAFASFERAVASVRGLAQLAAEKRENLAHV
jgi:hypothetical protein